MDIRQRITLTTAAAIAMAAAAPAASAKEFFDPGAADRFIEIEAHALAGASTILQDYTDKFPQLTELRINPGFACGAGAKVTFGLRDWLGLSTELNAMINNSSASAVMASDGATPVSVMELHNRYYTLNIPVYISVRFNISDNVRWNAEGGFYYSLGLGGYQQQSIYSSYINDMDQLVGIHTSPRPGYYNDAGAFINSSVRGDWGLHLGTTLELGRHVTVGLRTGIGLRNVADISPAGTVRPSVHNITVAGTAGWRF